VENAITKIQNVKKDVSDALFPFTEEKRNRKASEPISLREEQEDSEKLEQRTIITFNNALCSPKNIQLTKSDKDEEEQINMLKSEINELRKFVLSQNTQLNERDRARSYSDSSDDDCSYSSSSSGSSDRFKNNARTMSRAISRKMKNGFKHKQRLDLMKKKTLANENKNLKLKVSQLINSDKQNHELITHLKEEGIRSEMALDLHEKTISDYIQQLSECNQINEQLREQVRDLGEMITSERLEHKVKKQKWEDKKQDYLQLLEQYKEENNGHHQQELVNDYNLADLSRALDNSESRCNVILEEYNKLKQEYDSLQLRSEQFGEALAQSDNTNNQINLQYDIMESQLKEALLHIEELEADKKRMQKTIHEFDSEKAQEASFGSSRNEGEATHSYVLNKLENKCRYLEAEKVKDSEIIFQLKQKVELLESVQNQQDRLDSNDIEGFYQQLNSKNEEVARLKKKLLQQSDTIDEIIEQLDVF